MTKKHLQLSVLFFTVLIDMLGFGIVIPILPRYAEMLGATSWQIGFLVGVFSLAQLGMLPFLGRLSDRVGRKPVLLLSVFGTVLGYLLMGWTHSIFVMMLGRALDGAAGGNMSTIQAYMSDITPSEERSQGMGILGAAYGVGFIVGPLLGGWACHCYGPSAAMLMAAGLAALNLFCILFFLPESLSKKEAAIKPPSLFSILEHLDTKVFVTVIGTFFFMLAGYSLILTLLPLMVYYRFHLNELQVGYIYTMMGVIAIVVEGGLFGVFSKYLRDRWMILAGTVSMLLSFFLLPFVEMKQTMFLLFGMMALGDSLMTPALPAVASCSAESAWHGAALGLYQSAGSLARFVGPLLSGFFLTFNAHGPNYAQTACWAASLLLLGSFLCALKLPLEYRHERSS